MTRVPHHDIVEDSQSLWALTFPPLIWMAHFLVSYIAGSLWCGSAGRFAPLGAVAIGFAILTALALLGIAASGWRAWRGYKLPNQKADAVPSHHKDTPEDRHRFLCLATVLLAALSMLATLYVALAVAILGNCS
jgi:hypothetical protein